MNMHRLNYVLVKKRSNQGKHSVKKRGAVAEVQLPNIERRSILNVFRIYSNGHHVSSDVQEVPKRHSGSIHDKTFARCNLSVIVIIHREASIKSHQRHFDCINIAEFTGIGVT